MQSGLQSKNEFILYYSIFNADLHHAILNKDIKAIEKMLDHFTKTHLKNYDFSLYDSNTFIDIDYVYNKHVKELQEDNFCWAY